MKLWKISIVMATLIALTLAGCASTPEEPVPETDPVDEVVTEDPELDPDVEAVRPDLERETALDLRARIAERGIANEDPQNMEEADTAFAQAEDQLDVDNELAKEYYEESIDGYRRVLWTVFGDDVAELRLQTEALRAEADEVRAQRAAAESYNAGSASFNRGVAHADNRDYDLAYDELSESERQFRQSRDTAAERRAAAQRAIEMSRSTIENTEQSIREREQSIADSIAEDEAAAEAERELADEIEEDE